MLLLIIKCYSKVYLTQSCFWLELMFQLLRRWNYGLWKQQLLGFVVLQQHWVQSMNSNLKKKKSNSNSYKWCQFSLCIKYWSSKCNVSLNVALSNTYIYILWKYVLFSVYVIEPESINCVLGVLPLSELSWSWGLDELELCNFPANLL